MFLYFENGVKKVTEISVEMNFRSFFFLFTVQNVASGYTLCRLENSFFLLYVGIKIVTRKSVVFPINWNIEKNTNLHTEGLKRETKRINMKIT